MIYILLTVVILILISIVIFMAYVIRTTYLDQLSELALELEKQNNVHIKSVEDINQMMDQAQKQMDEYEKRYYPKRGKSEMAEEFERLFASYKNDYKK